MSSLSFLEKPTLAVIFCLGPASPANRSPWFQQSVWVVRVKFRQHLSARDALWLEGKTSDLWENAHKSSQLIIFGKLLVTKKRHREIPAGQCRLCGHDLGIRLPGGRLQSCFCHMLTTLYLSHLHVAREQSATSFNYSCLGLSQRAVPVCCVFAQMCSLLQSVPFSDVGSGRFEVCIVSRCDRLFQFLALATEQTVGFWIWQDRTPQMFNPR